MSEAHEFVALRLCIDIEESALSIGLFARNDVQIEAAAPADHIVTCVTTPMGDLFGSDAGKEDQHRRGYVVCDPGGALRLHECLGFLIEGLMDRTASVHDILGELSGSGSSEGEE
jgi:hypothetical protein